MTDKKRSNNARITTYEEDEVFRAQEYELRMRERAARKKADDWQNLVEQAKNNEK